MNTQELLAEIQKLPPEAQRHLLDSLSRSISQQPGPQCSISEDEVERILFEKGIIGALPNPADYSDENFEPIEVAGKPVSETIIESGGKWLPTSSTAVPSSNATPKRSGQPG